MATSGSINFTQTRNELILDAFQILGVYGIGRTVSAEDITFANSILNKMVKGWGAQGLHLFTKEEGVLYLTPGISQYFIGGSARTTKVTEEIQTSLNGLRAAGATSLTVDSTTGMAINDSIGVVLSDKTIHWTTIATVPTSTTLTISSGLTGAASDNGLVYTYTTAIGRILKVLDCRKRTGSGVDIVDLPIMEMGYKDYQNLPSKNQGGSPTQFAQNQQSSYCSVFLWGCPSDGAERIIYTYERVVEDLDSVSDNFDFPSEWLETLTYQLAVRLARPFGKAAALNDLMPMASQMLVALLDWDSEVVTVEFWPDLGGDC